MLLYIVALLALWSVYRWFKESKHLANRGDKHVYITGCDTGFGHLLAKHLDKRGFRVIAGCYTDKGEDELKKASSDRMTTLHLDVTDSASVAQATALIDALVGQKVISFVVWGVLTCVTNSCHSIPTHRLVLIKPALCIN
uniref:Dehydrogenase/reductase (SDR family) member 9 n=1 Tax=Hippocampus comes TaxID=109280 RepID=A0A3Q2XSQ6_HIPCM